MLKTVMNKILAVVVMATLCGCAAMKSTEPRIANPNNVYRFAKNTEVEVLIQDSKSGRWKLAPYKVVVPMGYYIGSGLED